ncbi:MAG: hypothetical protein LUE31_04095 [Lachnospiraceae bacterium]|nr:hypothetical protein [Lachnospiraceae bacterium]
MNEELRSAIRQAKVQAQYDAQCKSVLASKTILAWILRDTISEFSGYTLAEIEDCIGEPEISSIGVDAGSTHLAQVSVESEVSRSAHRGAEKIMGLANESNIPGEGSISYDICLAVYLPQAGEQRKIYVNVEAQRAFYPGYRIWSRGVYYVSRMVSAQKGVDFSGKNYDGIRKVYSIWICMNAPAYIGNAIAEVSLNQRDIVPGIPDQKSDYDKMSIVQIALNEEKENPCSLTGMLNVLLSMSLSGEKKLQVLQEEYQIDFDTDLEGKVDTMSNLGEYAVEYGYEKGMQQGIQQGMQQGIEQGRMENAKNMAISLHEAGVAEELIARAANVSVNLVRTWLDISLA